MMYVCDEDMMAGVLAQMTHRPLYAAFTSDTM